jgi:DNA repair protein RadC
MNKITNDTPAAYQATTQAVVDLQIAINTALQLLLEELQRRNLHTTVEAFTAPDIVKNYLTLALALEEREHFHVLFLNNQHKLLLDARLFSGTIDGASVYPREVVKQALQCNAAAVILAHNHPSGICVPSEADKGITAKLKQALTTVDIRILDHIIVGHMETYSFAEHGAL